MAAEPEEKARPANVEQNSHNRTVAGPFELGNGMFKLLSRRVPTPGILKFLLICDATHRTVR